MGVATQVTTFSDLFTDLMNRTRDDTGQTATQNQAKRYINVGLHDMHIGQSENFPWAIEDDKLTTRANYNTGTVAVTKGSATVTGTGTLWATNDDFGNPNVGGSTESSGQSKMRIGGGDDVYDVASVSSDVSLTLADPWIGETATALSYDTFVDVLPLAADFGRPLDQQRFASGAIDIPLIDRTTFRQRYPQNHIPNVPKEATIVKWGWDTASGEEIRRIRFHPPPSRAFLIPYSYITTYLAVTAGGVRQTQLVNDTDLPIVPLRYRHAIVFHALYHWYRDRKDDARSGQAKNEYAEIMVRVTEDIEVGGRRPRFRPDIAAYKRGARRPWRGGGRAGRSRYDLNGRFDRLEW